MKPRPKGKYEPRRYRIDRVRNAFVYLRIPREDHAELRRVAKQQGVSVNELVNTFVTWGLEHGNPGE